MSKISKKQKQQLRQVEAALDKKPLMGYTEDSSGNVVLRMIRKDYLMLLIAMGMACGSASKQLMDVKPWIELVNRVNDGNPDFYSYKTSDYDNKIPKIKRSRSKTR